MRQLRTSTIALLLALILPLALVSCDSSGTNDSGGENDSGSDTFTLNEGSFTATITEDGTETDVSGNAVYGAASNIASDNNNIASENGEAFILYLLEGEKIVEDDGDVGLAEGGTEIILSREDPTIPGTGMISLGRWTLLNRNPNISGGSSGGTVDITTAGDGTLEGTFEGDLGIAGLSVEGSFTAEESDDIDTVLCTPGCDDS